MDANNLIAFLAMWAIFGSTFALLDFIEALYKKIRKKSHLSWIQTFVYPAMVIILWPVVIVTLILQVCFPKTFARFRKWFDFKTRFYPVPIYKTEEFDPRLLKSKLCEVSVLEWQKPGYQYETTLDLYVYRNDKTGMLRIAVNYSESSGKFKYVSHWQTWIGKHNLFNSRLIEEQNE
ncbi:hypothetical protein HOU08_gp057 [Dickeya phage vB_DsoM_JA29]|uniref:Uncharacterized protein n=1 Tax=Dickeya phage vB_DsoM_JA29 TaxID=2283031 RepID=A0A384ZWZ5_9CAUD|nr:hypothetical protein HOU08_gp057 [Dickeya phage vB_DsoM_JA29]AXG66783.1 hypothetical protein JA29_057 [Dickeya phage vB_DsoM_JA29]